MQQKVSPLLFFTKTLANNKIKTEKTVAKKESYLLFQFLQISQKKDVVTEWHFKESDKDKAVPFSATIAINVPEHL